MYGTFTFPVDVPAEDYDPWTLPYGKAPPGLFAKTIQRTFPLRDFRNEVFNEPYSIETSRDLLREHGFTAVKHKTVLRQFPYGRLANFCDAQLVNEVYYPEIEELVKYVTGCARVCVTDSVVRVTDADKVVSDASWEKSTSTKDSEEFDKSPGFLRMHKPSPSPPTRLPHWDSTAVGARQTIRQWSEEIVENAHRRGIIAREDEIAGIASSSDQTSTSSIEANYDGPRYASFTVWRPLKRVTRDPLAMAPHQSVEADPEFMAVPHRIKQPGMNGDWLRELATLKARQERFQDDVHGMEHGLQWHYISDQYVDEVLLIKSFDSAALPGQRQLTGEAPGAAHASPDLGDAGFGDARESIEVRVVAFW